MKAFIEFSEANWAKMMNKDVELIDKAFELLEAAKTAVDKDSIYGKRVYFVDSYLSRLKKLKDKYALKREDNGKMRLYSGRTLEIKVDGKFDEFFDITKWRYGHWLKQNKKFIKPKTWYRTLWKKEGLYFAIHCKNPEADNLKAGTTQNDDPAIFDGDRFEILLETQNHAYYQIVVNSAGAIYDADWKNGSNPKWNSEAKVAINKGKDFWNAEIMIPIADEMQEEDLPLLMVSGREPKNLEPWYFRVARLTEPQADKSKFHDPGKFRILYMRK
jgi:hypothetical protein